MRTLPAAFLALALSFAAHGQSRQAVTPVPKVEKKRADYGKYDFTLTTLEGKTLRLSDYTGKVVLVNIWAPWCGPCRLEMPGFVKLYKEYEPKGFEIIGVAVQTNEDAVNAFREKTPLAWPNGINNDVGVQYGGRYIPNNYLFAPDGSVIKHFVGYTKEEALRALLDEALKKTPGKVAQ